MALPVWLGFFYLRNKLVFWILYEFINKAIQLLLIISIDIIREKPREKSLIKG